MHFRIQESYNANVVFILGLTVILFSCGRSRSNELLQTGITAVRDTSSAAINEFDMTFPNIWELIPKYKGTTLMGLSPAFDSTDNFRENISVQIFNLNDNFSSEEAASYLFEQSIKFLDDNYQIFSKGYWPEKGDNKFYAIEYRYSFNNIIAQSKLFCTVQNQKAYLLVCTGKPDEFNNFLVKEFNPIIKSFKLKR